MSTEDYDLTIDPTIKSVLVIAEPAGELVRLNPDGTIVFGPNYTPNEACRIFWETLAQHAGPFLGFATTAVLLNELQVRFEVSGNASAIARLLDVESVCSEADLAYRTVDS